MNVIEILSIILIHWFTDFVMQTDEQAKGKSKEWKWLLLHTSTYSMAWWLVGVIVFPFAQLQGVVIFVVLTLIIHTITDYFTSRINSKLWAEGKTHKFFVSIGFDQFLHYTQLFICYWWLFK